MYIIISVLHGQWIKLETSELKLLLLIYNGRISFDRYI